MKKLFFLFLITTLACGAAFANTTTFYSTLPPNVNTSLASVIGLSYVQGDRFVPTSTGTVNELLVAIGNNGLTYAPNVTFTIYGDNSGLPGTALTSFVVQGVGLPYWKSGTLQTIEFTGVPVVAGTPYWLMAAAAPGIDYAVWAMSTSSSGNHLSIDAFGHSQDPARSDGAFELRGTAVPEPGSLILLGSGMLGAIGAIRRKLAR